MDSGFLNVVDNIGQAEFLEKYLLKNKPVIIRGGVADWPAVKKWNLDYLKSTIGENKIQLKRHYKNDKEWLMADFFADLEAGVNDRYLTNGNIVEFFPQLVEDLSPYSQYALPDWKCNRFLPDNMHYDNYQVELLAGNPSTGFYLHYDRGHINAFVAQIVGRKRVALLPPESAQYLNADGNVSKVDVWQLEQDNDPLLDTMQAGFFTLEPGDLVFIPANWWHTTKNETQSFGVTFNSVYKHNWADFSKYVSLAKKKRTGSTVKAFALYIFMRTLGAYFLMREKLFGINQRHEGLEKYWGTD